MTHIDQIYRPRQRHEGDTGTASIRFTHSRAASCMAASIKTFGYRVHDRKDGTCLLYAEGLRLVCLDLADAERRARNIFAESVL